MVQSTCACPRSNHVDAIAQTPQSIESKLQVPHSAATSSISTPHTHRKIHALESLKVLPNSRLLHFSVGTAQQSPPTAAFQIPRIEAERSRAHMPLRLHLCPLLDSSPSGNVLVSITRRQRIDCDQPSAGRRTGASRLLAQELPSQIVTVSNAALSADPHPPRSQSFLCRPYTIPTWPPGAIGCATPAGQSSST